MMRPSYTYTSLVLDAPEETVDPRLLEQPVLVNWEVFIAATNQAIPVSPPCVDAFAMCPDLVSDDGNSQWYVTRNRSCCANAPETRFHCYSSSPPPCTPQNYDFPSPPPQFVHIDHGSLYSPFTASLSPTLSATRVLIEAPCAEGRPIKQKGGYSCSSCGKFFRRRDDTKRHIDSAGARVTCKYCGKPSSMRRDGQQRHLAKNKNCLKAWGAGVKAGHFTVRTVEDAYN